MENTQFVLGLPSRFTTLDCTTIKNFWDETKGSGGKAEGKERNGDKYPRTNNGNIGCKFDDSSTSAIMSLEHGFACNRKKPSALDATY